MFDGLKIYFDINVKLFKTIAPKKVKKKKKKNCDLINRTRRCATKRLCRTFPKMDLFFEKCIKNAIIIHK